jgi:prepilin signal peptidase PulO-like enzyme (type II secretory pathway)
MELFFLSMLFIFGTMFGSFASVIIYRIRSGEGGIMTGRSHCKTCQRNLTVLDLIPLLSWIFSRGVCRKCKEKISAVYLLLEIIMGIWFLCVWVFLIDISAIINGSMLEMLKLLFWEIIIFLTVIYVFYDLLFLEIPEIILLIANIFTFFILAYMSFESSANLIPTLESARDIPFLLSLGLAILIFCSLYTIMLSGMSEKNDTLILIVLGVMLWSTISYFQIPVLGNPLLSGTIAGLVLFLFFFAQILVSGGAWMGGGDLRIALLMGMLLGLPFLFFGSMLAYFIWSVIGVALILHNRVKNGLKKELERQIPFGPFLALGYFGIVFFVPFWEKIMERYFL